MVMIFSWDPSSKIIFLHVVLGGGVGGGGGSVFATFSEFSRHYPDNMWRNDLAGKRLCREITGKSYSDFLNHINNFFLAICKEPKRVLLSLD